MERQEGKGGRSRGRTGLSSRPRRPLLGRPPGAAVRRRRGALGEASRARTPTPNCLLPAESTAWWFWASRVKPCCASALEPPRRGRTSTKSRLPPFCELGGGAERRCRHRTRLVRASPGLSKFEIPDSCNDNPPTNAFPIAHDIMSERGNFRGGRGGGRGDRGGRGGSSERGGRGGGQAGTAERKKENILDLTKYMDKEITVKFNGGREGALMSGSRVQERD